MKKIRKKIFDLGKYKKNKNGNISIPVLEKRVEEIKMKFKLKLKRSKEKKLLRREMKELSKIIKKENLKNS